MLSRGAAGIMREGRPRRDFCIIHLSTTKGAKAGGGAASSRGEEQAIRTSETRAPAALRYKQKLGEEKTSRVCGDKSKAGLPGERGRYDPKAGRLKTPLFLDCHPRPGKG